MFCWYEWGIIDLFSYVCKLPISDHVMFSGELFLCLSGNYSFISTLICLNLKEIILKGNITWSEMGQQTNEAKEVYSFNPVACKVPFWRKMFSDVWEFIYLVSLIST